MEVAMDGCQIRAALENLSQTFAGYPEKARAKQAPAIVNLESGLKCRVVGLPVKKSKPTYHGRWAVARPIRTQDGFSGLLWHHAARL
jgi:hypothetical protein